MKRYTHDGATPRRLPRRLAAVTTIVVLLIVAAAIGTRHIYFQNLQPVSSNPTTQLVVIPSGSSVKQIGTLLADKQLIHNSWVFAWYVHSNELSDKLKAGTYAFSPNQKLASIVATLTKGKVTTNLVTILPGRRIDQVRADLINDGFTPTAVDAALTPSNYKDMPVLSYAPANVSSLEGLLYPDSFERTADTDPAVIIRESLTEMSAHLPASLQTAYANEGLSVYQGITLASIVEQEVSKQSDRTQVAQVFLSRLKQGMMLGSDVTANYGAIIAGHSPSLSYDSPYNTLLHSGLPPGPISSVSNNSLQAVASPANTDWLYFVAGDDGTTHFEQTGAQHQADAAQYCQKLCAAEAK